MISLIMADYKGKLYEKSRKSITLPAMAYYAHL